MRLQNLQLLQQPGAAAVTLASPGANIVRLGLRARQRPLYGWQKDNGFRNWVRMEVGEDRGRVNSSPRVRGYIHQDSKIGGDPGADTRFATLTLAHFAALPFQEERGKRRWNP
jgi:hypothetical protein